MPVTPAMWEVESGGSQVQGSLAKLAGDLTTKTKDWEHSSSGRAPEVLGSIPSIGKKISS
jgi:hypothetical protein